MTLPLPEVVRKVTHKRRHLIEDPTDRQRLTWICFLLFEKLVINERYLFVAPKVLGHASPSLFKETLLKFRLGGLPPASYPLLLFQDTVLGPFSQ